MRINASQGSVSMYLMYTIHFDNHSQRTGATAVGNLSLNVRVYQIQLNEEHLVMPVDSFH